MNHPPLRTGTPFPFRAAAPPPAGQGQSRSVLTPADRFRNYAVIWRRDGIAQVNSASLIDSAGKSTPVTLGRMDVAYWLPSFNHYWRVQIPDGIKAGQYTLTLAPGQSWAFTVAPQAKPRKLALLPANVTPNAAAQALAAGNDIVLPPGGLLWDAAVSVPSGASIYADGCRLTYAPKTPSRSLFTVGNNVSIHGLDLVEYVGTSDIGMLVSAPVGASGLIVRYCTIRDGILGFWLSEALIESCDFAGGGAIIAPVGLWTDNAFRDTRSGLQPLNFWYGSGATAVFRSRFTRTPRGTVFQANSGPINDNLFVGSWHDQIASDGGGEIYLKENPTNPFDRNLIFDTRVTGSSSAVFAFDNNASNNAVYGSYLDGDCEIRLGFAGPGVVGNLFQRFSLTRGRITCAAGATGNVFDTGSVGGAARSDDPSNVLHAVTAPDASGFTVRV